jgi:hypothetical protein
MYVENIIIKGGEKLKEGLKGINEVESEAVPLRG